MLQGDAKRDYQRDYMRRKRSGEPTAKEWEPSQSMISDVGHWFSLALGRPHDLHGIGYKVVDGLAPNNDDGTANEASWNEALRRYKALRDQARADRKAKRDAPPEPPCCSFCGEPRTAKRVLIGGNGGYPMICAKCSKRVAGLFAKQAKKVGKR